MAELEAAASPAGIELSPVSGRHQDPDIGANSPSHSSQKKVCGCIPLQIHGDFGCLCRGRCPVLSSIKYFINPTVFFSAIVIIWSFVIWCAADRANASEVLAETQSFAVKYFGWFYICSLIIFGAFSLYLTCSKYGDIKLGPEDEEPKYSLMTWFSMLFSAGIGAGLYYFGVAEPVMHFDAMQAGNSRWYHLTTNQQAMEALNVAWFHWVCLLLLCFSLFLFKLTVQTKNKMCL